VAKLYFRYGTVGSAKTLNLLAVAHNYEAQGKKVLVVKPEVDDRFGKEHVASRAGLSRKADCVISDAESPTIFLFGGKTNCVLVDEAQFFKKETIDIFRDIATNCDVPVICYGLRADFRGELFEGSKRLFELADDIQEVKTVCYYCNRKAIMNLKHIEGVPTTDGPSIQLGAEETYLPACFKCYHEKLNEQSQKETSEEDK
jgi:thymidine kinase